MTMYLVVSTCLCLAVHSMRINTETAKITKEADPPPPASLIPSLPSGPQVPPAVATHVSPPLFLPSDSPPVPPPPPSTPDQAESPPAPVNPPRSPSPLRPSHKQQAEDVKQVAYDALTAFINDPSKEFDPPVASIMQRGDKFKVLLAMPGWVKAGPHGSTMVWSASGDKDTLFGTGGFETYWTNDNEDFSMKLGIGPDTVRETDGTGRVGTVTFFLTGHYMQQGQHKVLTRLELIQGEHPATVMVTSWQGPPPEEEDIQGNGGALKTQELMTEAGSMQPQKTTASEGIQAGDVEGEGATIAPLPEAPAENSGAAEAQSTNNQDGGSSDRGIDPDTIQMQHHKNLQQHFAAGSW